MGEPPTIDSGRSAAAGASEGDWFHATAATHGQVGDMLVPSAQYPDGTQVVRFSLRMRDDAFAGDQTRRLYIDSIRLSQE